MPVPLSDWIATNFTYFIARDLWNRDRGDYVQPFFIPAPPSNCTYYRICCAPNNSSLTTFMKLVFSRQHLSLECLATDFTKQYTSLGCTLLKP